MLTTVLILASIIVDIGLGGAAYKHTKLLEKKLDALEKKIFKE